MESIGEQNHAFAIEGKPQQQKFTKEFLQKAFNHAHYCMCKEVSGIIIIPKNMTPILFLTFFNNYYF